MSGFRIYIIKRFVVYQKLIFSTQKLGLRSQQNQPVPAKEMSGQLHPLSTIKRLTLCVCVCVCVCVCACACVCACVRAFVPTGDTLYYRFVADMSNTEWGYKFTVTGGHRGRFQTGRLTCKTASHCCVTRPNTLY